MNWKKILRITAVTLIPGGLVMLGGWLRITALTATIAVKEVLAGVDIEGRSGLRVQRTGSHELGTVTCRPGRPILLPQILEQGQALFEFFEILAHGAVLPLETSLRESGQRSQARMVGEKGFSQRRRGQRICRRRVSAPNGLG